MDPLHSPTASAPETHSRPCRRRLAALAAAVFGLALSAQLAALVHGWEAERAESRFRQAGERWLRIMRLELDRLLGLPYYLGSIFLAPKDVSDKEFHAFADAVTRDRPEIDTIVWSPRQPDTSPPVYSERLRLRRDGPTWRLETTAAQWQGAAAPDGVIDPILLTSAARTASAVVSSRVTIDAGDQPEPGVVIVGPIRNKPIPAEPIGLISLRLSVPTLIKQLREHGYHTGLAVQVHDITDGSLPILLYSSDLAGNPAAMLDSRPPPDERADDAGLIRHLEVGGRHWLVTLRPSQPYTVSPWGQSVLTLLAGASLTTLVVMPLLRRRDPTAPAVTPVTHTPAPQEQTQDAEALHWRHMVESSPDMILLLNAEGRVRYVSPSCTRLLGWQPEQMSGRSIYDFFHPDDIYRTRHAHEFALANPGNYLSSYRVRRADGGYSWLEAHNRMLQDEETGAATEILCVVRDTSGRQTEVDALRESEVMYRGAFENAATPMLLADAYSGQLLRVNQALCDMLGYSKPELRELKSRDITHPADWELTVEGSRAARANLKGVELNKRFLRKDGSLVPARVLLSVQRDPEGNARHFISHILPRHSRAE